jgi:hypothetical protein
LEAKTHISLFLKMLKFSNIICLKEQILVKKNEESFQGILIFGNGICEPWIIAQQLVKL